MESEKRGEKAGKQQPPLVREEGLKPKGNSSGKLSHSGGCGARGGEKGVALLASAKKLYLQTESQSASRKRKERNHEVKIVRFQKKSGGAEESVGRDWKSGGDQGGEKKPILKREARGVRSR